MNTLHELILELTDWCPLKCLHCSSNSGSESNNYLEKNLVIQLIEEAKNSGAKKISFGGGEPTSHQEFFPALNHAVKSGMLTEVFTCGIENAGTSIRSFSPKLISDCTGLEGFKFIFSFHGASAEVHDYVTQTPGSFITLKDSLQRCLNAGIKCEINFVPMRVNSYQLEDVTELAKDFGLKKVSLLRFVPQGRGLINREKLELLSEEGQFVEEVLQLRNKSDVKIRTGSPFNGIIPGNRVPCKAGKAKLVVQANGNVLPCEVFKHHERCDWGLSVYNHSLDDICNSSQVFQLYKSVMDSDCLSCPVHSSLRNNYNLKQRSIDYVEAAYSE